MQKRGGGGGGAGAAAPPMTQTDLAKKGVFALRRFIPGAVAEAAAPTDAAHRAVAEATACAKIILREDEYLRLTSPQFDSVLAKIDEAEQERKEEAERQAQEKE